MKKDENLIVIVDDSEIIRNGIKNCLIATDYQFVEAVDGLEGIEVVKKFGDKISLLIIDLNMPKLNGIEMMEEMSSHSIGNDIPKILLTSEPPHEFLSLKTRIPNLQAVMMKPIMEQKFIAVINKIIGIQK